MRHFSQMKWKAQSVLRIQQAVGLRMNRYNKATLNCGFVKGAEPLFTAETALGAEKKFLPQIHGTPGYSRGKREGRMNATVGPRQSVVGCSDLGGRRFT